MQKISYVIPCYRSQHTVGGVVAEIAATMQTLPQYDYEVILVNDCSPDDTFGTIRSLVAADSHVVGVDLAKNFGQHAALMAGFHKCSGDIVVCLDDDGQTPADEVGKLLAKIDEGYDVVYASYDTKRQAGWRNLGSWVNSKMTEIMLGKIWSMGLVVLLATAFSLNFIVQWALKVPIEGSLALFLAVATLHLFVTTSIGIFMATLARSMPQFGLFLLACEGG